MPACFSSRLPPLRRERLGQAAQRRGKAVPQPLAEATPEGPITLPYKFPEHEIAQMNGKRNPHRSAVPSIEAHRTGGICLPEERGLWPLCGPGNLVPHSGIRHVAHTQAMCPNPFREIPVVVPEQIPRIEKPHGLKSTTVD